MVLLEAMSASTATPPAPTPHEPICTYSETVPWFGQHTLNLQTFDRVIRVTVLRSFI